MASVFKFLGSGKEQKALRKHISEFHKLFCNLKKLFFHAPFTFLQAQIPFFHAQITFLHTQIMFLHAQIRPKSFRGHTKPVLWSKLI